MKKKMNENHLTEDECRFLMGCVTMANGEGMYIFDRKYPGFQNSLNENDIINLLKKLGATEDDIDEYKRYE